MERQGPVKTTDTQEPHSNRSAGSRSISEQGCGAPVRNVRSGDCQEREVRLSPESSYILKDLCYTGGKYPQPPIGHPRGKG